MRRYNATVHPYVIEVDTNSPSRNGTTTLGFTLFGRGIAHLPLVHRVLREAGEVGIGKSRSRFLITDVLQETTAGSNLWRSILEPNGSLTPLRIDQAEIPIVPHQVRIRFLTPLRLKGNGELVHKDEFAFHHLFRNLLRRVSMLCYFHDTPFETDFATLTAMSREVKLQRKNLMWRELSRWSSRQQTEMMMGGLIGSVELDGKGLDPFWPFLWLGQWTHAGKGAVMGMGHYRLENPASLPEIVE